jgi:hypothetical protein
VPDEAPPPPRIERRISANRAHRNPAENQTGSATTTPREAQPDTGINLVPIERDANNNPVRQYWSNESIKLVEMRTLYFRKNIDKGLYVLWNKMRRLRDKEEEMSMSNEDFRVNIPKWFSHARIPGFRPTTPPIEDTLVRVYLNELAGTGLVSKRERGVKGSPTKWRVYGVVEGLRVFVPVCIAKWCGVEEEEVSGS